MKIDEYETAKNLILKCNNADYKGPIPEILIAKAQNILGIQFPPSYRRFLKDFGSLGILSEEIYGIVDEDLLRGPLPNGIWATLEQRKNFGLKKNYVILGTNGSGEWYALDTSRVNAAAECPVVLLTLALTQSEDVSDDFAEFFLQRVNMAIEP
jgi:hypothetical protein